MTDAFSDATALLAGLGAGQLHSAGLVEAALAWIAAAEAQTLRRMRAAGAVLIGKLNLHEGALGATTDNPVCGRCQNPVRPVPTPGGSAGGSAAATAGLEGERHTPAPCRAAGLGPIARCRTGGASAKSIRRAAGAKFGLARTRGLAASRGMTPFRLLHSSDLHLGRAFGNFPEGIRHRLREARHGAIGRLAAAARAGGAATVLLAGDTFDAETPAPETLRQALAAMREAADLTWLLLPGNHDSLAATELWRRIAADGPPNLRALVSDEPVEMAPGVWLLPAPCTQRRPGRDLTEALSAATPAGALRIGLGHGAITDFSGEEGATGIIPPDRALRSGLDYLALGDWHGQLQVGPATWYSGTPEPDSFKHEARGGALLVTLGGPAPQIDRVETASFRWLRPVLDLLPGEGAAARLAALLPKAGARDHLVRLALTGRLPLAERAALEADLAHRAPDFGWFSADLSALAVTAQPEDLDQIDRAGALRQAAETLLAEAGDASLSQAERETAAAALARLYGFAQEVRG